jgi:hypothetical protein
LTGGRLDFEKESPALEGGLASELAHGIASVELVRTEKFAEAGSGRLRQDAGTEQGLDGGGIFGEECGGKFFHDRRGLNGADDFRR